MGTSLLSPSGLFQQYNHILSVSLEETYTTNTPPFMDATQMPGPQIT